MAEGGSTILGDTRLGNLGRDVEILGDINGDGFDDFAVAATDAADQATTLVIFGTARGLPSPIRAADLDGRIGTVFDATVGRIDGVGDVNGDGIDDFVAVNAQARRRAVDGGDTHDSFLILGGGGFDAWTSLDDLVARPGTVRIAPGADPLNPAATLRGAAAAGDLDGDGIGDLALAYSFESGGRPREAVLVVPGGDLPARINLLAPPSGATRLLGPGERQDLGAAIAHGDLNGDGIDDLVLGAPRATVGESVNDSAIYAGQVYVVHGAAGGLGSSVTLSQLSASRGSILSGWDNLDQAGYAVAVAGDVNGDGFNDLFVGAPGAESAPDGETPFDSGIGYVLFGSAEGFRARQSLEDLTGLDGIELGLFNAGAALGLSAAAPGDVNGDGFDDLLVGLPLGRFPNTNSPEAGGLVLLAFGRADAPQTDGPRVDVEELVEDGEAFVFVGPARDTRAGFSMSAAGDVDGDGLADFLIGAPNAAVSGIPGAGQAYLIHGGIKNLTALDAADGARDGVIRLENATGTAAARDGVAQIGRVGRDLLTGSARGDDLSGLGGADILRGNAGDDVLSGGAGDDFLDGGAGADTVLGGEGADLLYGRDGANRLDGGAGDDRINGGDAAETLIGGDGADVVRGEAGDDLIDLGAGADVAIGWRGADTILGGAGDDVLRGDFDDDRIEGGTGADRLLGGSGRDVFVFRQGFEEDRLLDFRRGSDRLDFTDHDAVAGLADLDIRQVGANVLILDDSGGRIVISALDAGDLRAADFLFG